VPQEIRTPGMSGLAGRRWRWACGLVLAGALAALAPTTGDIGLTWDEPAYRYSQMVSAQWWQRLARARTRADLAALLDPDALLYYWPYGRHGINFHPPLAGQLDLLTYELLGGFLKDMPARRMASVLELALTVTIAFGFLAGRYGPWVGGVAAGSLLLIPRVYGHGHIAGTDTPGLLLWAATAVACWNGLHEPGARRWRIGVGVLLGLAFVEKMGAVTVLIPTLAWLLIGHLPKTFVRRGGRADWIDGLVTTAALLAPLGLAYLEIRRLARLLPPPAYTDLFLNPHHSALPGAILLVPLILWMTRRLLGRVFRAHPVWGPERPALETWTAILAFAPAVGWLGNPAWWRETMPRLAHYYTLNTARQGALPDIRIYYWGRTYLYSLPWHNAWVLIAITVPAGILAAAIAGLVYVVRKARRDRLPLYFLAHLVTLPVLRMLPTPAHDGVRLFLPTFFFLAALAGWGSAWVADGAARLLRGRATAGRVLLAGLVLGPAALQLAWIHPFELSYYNELIGGPRGAQAAGFELSYWYDAFNGRTLAGMNRLLPPGAALAPPNHLSQTPTFQELQALGALRGDIRLDGQDPEGMPFQWLLTHDSKADSYSQLLFALRPWDARRPLALDGLRVATVADPVAVSRAWALHLLAGGTDGRPHPPGGHAPLPSRVRRLAPWLGRFWGEGLMLAPLPGADEAILAWARDDPDGLRAEARAIVGGRPGAERLATILTRFDGPAPEQRFAAILLRARPRALIEAVEILIARPEAVRWVLGRYGYTDPDAIGGYLDADLPRDGPDR
jgi:hypothetical protein